MRRKRLLIGFIICIIFIVGCSKNNDGANINGMFNVQTAKLTALEYMQRLVSNDIEGANAISSPSVAANNKVKKIKEEPIIAFSAGNLTETGQSAYIIFNTIRLNNKNKGADLDQYTLKVEKSGKEYKIADIKSENLRQIYQRDTELRSVNKGTGDSDLILRLKDLPLELYTKDDKVPLQKVIVPKDKFGVMSMDFKGGTIALSTDNGKDSFIGIAMIEDAQQTFASSSSMLAQDDSKQIDENKLRKIVEKPIAQNIIGYDILKDCIIKKMMFTEEGSELIVQYTKGKNMGLKIYKTPDGEPLKIDFEKLFPIDKYEVTYKGGSQSKLIITVNSSSGTKGIYQDAIGDYAIDLSKEELSKL